MYATKRRQRNFKRVREPAKPITSTNPSKRHRERLNGELETVAGLLPYDGTVISRLDKLSVLRLAVSFLEVKTHFQACLQKQYTGYYGTNGYGSLAFNQPTKSDSNYCSIENMLKALGGFILMLNENGEIYYTSDNIETYLGFHQSDILHQPVFDMIHSEDREELRQQLMWNYNTPATLTLQQLFDQDGTSQLERNASARFRCLLDNTCGFLRIDIRGKLTCLHGLPHCYVSSRQDPSMPVLGLIAVCTPFVPPPSLDGPDTEPFLKTKHSLDFSLFSMDAKAKMMVEIEDKSLPTSFYGVVHCQDTICLAEAHKEVIKSGASGLLVYRVIGRRTKRVYWLQSSCRLFYKNGKPESIGCTHRLLTESEGLALLEKRASLSAKLLSFDDSLLQSPKLLQSTAALTSSGGSTTTHKIKNKKQKNMSTTPAQASSSRATSSTTSALRNAAAAAAALTGQSSMLHSGLNLPSFGYKQPSTSSLYPQQQNWLYPAATSQRYSNQPETNNSYYDYDIDYKCAKWAAYDSANAFYNPAAAGSNSYMEYSNAKYTTNNLQQEVDTKALVVDNNQCPQIYIPHKGINHAHAAFSMSEVTNTLLSQ